jgi:hemolysin activation/secretion protein
MRKVVFFLSVLLLTLSISTTSLAAPVQPPNQSIKIVTAQANQGSDLDEEIPETEGILIKEITIEGNTVVDTPALQAIVAPFLNTELTIEDMGALTDLVTMAYQDAGYLLARAFLPEQEIKDGILKITVAEGNISKITVEGQSHYRNRVILRYFKPQETHGVLNESMLEKGLLMTNETPNLKTNVILKEGAQPGEVEVVINTEDTSVLTFGTEIGLDYNNFGDDVISKNRYGATIRITDHFFGSTTTLRGVTGDNFENSTLGIIDFAAPVNSYGSKLNLYYLKSNYVVGQQLADLGLEGWSEYYGVKFYHPFLKKKNKNLSLTFGYDHKFSKNLLMGENYSIDDINLFHATLNYDSVDRFLGKNIISFGGYAGTINFDDEFPTSRGYEESFDDDNFYKLLLHTARIQKIRGHTNLMLRASGQYSDQRLVAMEMFGIGGYGTVRGYNTSLFLGDSGFNLSGELMFAPPFIADETLFNQRISQLVQLAIFYDYGQVKNNTVIPGEYGSRSLSGCGAGIRLYYKEVFAFKYDFGYALENIEGEPDYVNYFLVSLNFS